MSTKTKATVLTIVMFVLQAIPIYKHPPPTITLRTIRKLSINLIGFSRSVKLKTIGFIHIQQNFIVRIIRVLFKLKGRPVRASLLFFFIKSIT
ncbi:MAG: hypothetical protein ACTS82_00470 [Arsenophonus sp. ET-DL12-MAG3]